MKLGIIARADDRGIAWQTLEMVRHLHPAKVLCVLMDDPAWPEDVGRFGRIDTTIVSSNLSPNLADRGTFDERRVRKFLDGLDVVFAVETVYDWRFIDWAHDMGVKVLIAGNPEFTAHHNNPSWSHPDLWVWPTPWMADHLDALGYGRHELPVPVEAREQVAADPDDEVLNILHVGGKAAALDRAGTLDFIEAVAGIRQRVHVRYITQERDVLRKVRHGANVTVEVVTGGVADRWSMYEGMHLLVSPRRYGGLHLPALEAMACGLAVLLPDCSPNHIWPGPRIPARKGRTFRSPFGKIQTYATHPIDIIQMVDRLGRDRDRLAAEMDDAARWAENNTWEALRPRLYDPLLEELTA